MVIVHALTGLAAGVLLSGVTIATVQAAIGLAIRPASRGPSHPAKFLDWLQRVASPTRIDHSPMYSFSISAVFLISVFWMIAGPLPNSVIFTLPSDTQMRLAACLFIGSGTCMYGIAMGTPFDPWRRCKTTLRTLRNQPPPPPLDLRRAYQVGASGLPAVVAGLAYYTVILIRDTPLGWTAPSAIFAGFISLGMTFHTLRFLTDIRRINKALPMLIKQEIERINEDQS